jgi:hypothetical protein
VLVYKAEKVVGEEVEKRENKADKADKQIEEEVDNKLETDKKIEVNKID